MDSLVRLSEINQAKTFKFHLPLSKEQTLTLMSRLDLLSLKKVSLTGFLSPLDKDKWILKAELKATVRQKCVITLKPVQTIINETINRTFSPLEAQNSSDKLDDGVSQIFFDDTLQEFNDPVDLLDTLFPYSSSDL